MKDMEAKLKENAPYNIFFTTVSDSPETFAQSYSIQFKELLCPSLGELKCSLHLNFLVDIEWLIQQYDEMGQSDKPLTVLYGFEQDFTESYGEECSTIEKYIQLQLPNVKGHFMKGGDEFGIHHSKVAIFVYNDNSLRVVISTANLYANDWTIYCNGLWISPPCPVLPQGSRDTAGAGTGYFKPTLLSYLSTYNDSLLEEYMDYVKHADFSAVQVCLVTSAPGAHKASDWPVQSHLHRVGELLSLHCKLPCEKTHGYSQNTTRSWRGGRRQYSSSAEGSVADYRTSSASDTNEDTAKKIESTASDDESLSWEILAQASTIGHLGYSEKHWLSTTLLRSLSSYTQCRLPPRSKATMNIVYPTEDNVLGGYYGTVGAGCLCYWMDTPENQQTWPIPFLHSWKADCTKRTQAMPHIKTYCRISPCKAKLAWFFLTSANISKSAWGTNMSKEGVIYNRNYEVGVLFLPKYFNEEYFRIKNDSNTETEKLFPFICDLPLRPYTPKDEPWCHIKNVDEELEESEKLQASQRVSHWKK